MTGMAAGSRAVMMVTATTMTDAGDVFGLYCDANGVLRLQYVSGLANRRFFIMLTATAQYPNY